MCRGEDIDGRATEVGVWELAGVQLNHVALSLTSSTRRTTSDTGLTRKGTPLPRNSSAASHSPRSPDASMNVTACRSSWM